MIIDHIGLFLFPNLLVLRIIGRLSFPLFSWLIANGAHHTKNIDTYLKRIIIFAFISQFAYALANRNVENFDGYNVLFTLFFALSAIKVIKVTRDKKLWVVSTIIFMVLATVINSDYGAFGVLSTVLFYLYFSNFNKLAASQTALFLIATIIQLLIARATNAPSWSYLIWLIEPLGLLSLLFINHYNNKSGPKAKYLFYVFYPLQYVVFFVLNLALS